jgi:transposase
LALCEWLAAYRVTHIAMEATGVYWQRVWHIIEDDFELTLCNADMSSRSGPQDRHL